MHKEILKPVTILREEFIKLGKNTRDFSHEMNCQE